MNSAYDFNLYMKGNFEMKFNKIPVIIQNEQGFIVKYIVPQASIVLSTVKSE
jgi:hypothetical protein